LQCASTTAKAIAFRAERLSVARLAKHFLADARRWGALMSLAQLELKHLFAILESFVAQVRAIQRLQKAWKERAGIEGVGAAHLFAGGAGQAWFVPGHTARHHLLERLKFMSIR
jgi:hypothetical protein